ncbi:MAG: FprA family A-type flavoprotein, partial [Oscillospiraceae bacterium]|nr:FprA family A-type flavoprotein [Oscillospiraceae bacterium]
LKKLSDFEIQAICPLHGPVLQENLAYYLDKYNTWSKYEPEDKGVFIAYASIHGNTAKAANMLADILRKKGEQKVVVADLSRDDMAEAVEDAFRYDRIVFAAASYDGGVFLPMEDFLVHLRAKAYQNRTAAILENGSWAPSAGKVIRGYLDCMKNINVLESTVTIRSAVKKDTEKQLEDFADAIISAV